MADSDIDISVGLRILNTELKALKKQITDSLSSIDFDISANVTPKSRGGRVRSALSGGLISGTSQQREKIRDDALSALDQQAKSASKTMQKQSGVVDKLSGTITELRSKLKEAIDGEGEASEAAKRFATQLSSSERSLIKAQIKQEKLANEFNRLQGAIATFKAFVEKSFNPNVGPAAKFQADVRQLGGQPNGKVAAPTEKAISASRIAAREASRAGRTAGSQIASGAIDFKEAQSRINSIISNFGLKSEDASKVFTIFADKLESAITKTEQALKNEAKRTDEASRAANQALVTAKNKLAKKNLAEEEEAAKGAQFARQALIKAQDLQGKAHAQAAREALASAKDQVAANQKAENLGRIAIQKANDARAAAIDKVVANAFDTAKKEREATEKAAEDARKIVKRDEIKSQANELANLAKKQAKDSAEAAKQDAQAADRRGKVALEQFNRDEKTNSIIARDAIKQQAAALKEIAKEQLDAAKQKTADQNKLADESGRIALKQFKEDQKRINQTQQLNSKLARATEDVIKAQEEKARAIRRSATQEAAGGNISGPAGAAAQSIGGFGRGIGGALGAGNGRDQEALSRIILKQTGIVKDNERALFGLSNSLNNTNKFTQRYAENLRLGQRAAFEFGVSAAQAADRLAAWAVPSLFVFNTISALKNATDQIVALDTQARRLAFFQIGPDNPFEALAKAAGTAAPTLKDQIALSFQLINNEAIKTGINIKEVTDAILEVTRVGQRAFEVQTVFNGLQKETKLVASSFLEAVLGAVRIEGGALSASRAVEILNATLEQNNLTAKDSIQIISLLANAANESSTDLDGLGTVVNRVGSAFANLQNATPAETIQLAATAITRLGTNPSRAATALRQLSTLFTRFGKEIKEATGIEVIDASGQLTGLDAVLDALEKVRELRGTPGGFKIADLLAEAENIPDFQNLAEGVDDFRQKLKEVSGESSLLFTRNAVSKFLQTNQAQTESFSATLERLNATIIKFAKEINLDAAFSGFASGISKALDGTSSFISSIKSIPGLISGIGSATTAVAALFLSRKFVDAGAGFISASIGKNLTKVRDQISEATFTDGAQFRGAEVINRIQKEGFINEARASELRKEAASVLEKQVRIEAAIEARTAKINVLRKSAVTDAALLTKQEEKLNRLNEARNLNLTAELNLRKKIVAETSKQSNIASFEKTGRNQAILSAAVAGGFVIAQGLASGIENQKTRSTVQNALTGLLTGGGIGAAIGSAIAPGVGTAIGAAIGGVVGGGLGIYQSLNEGQRELNEQKQNEKKIEEAVASQRQQLLRQSENRLKAAINLSRLEEKLLKLQGELEVSQLDLVEAQRKGLGIAAAETRVREKTTEVIAIQKQLQLDEIALQEERINSENRLNAIKQRGARIISAIGLVEANSLERLRQQNVSPPIIRQVQLEFDRKKLQAEAGVVQKQLERSTIRIQTLRGQTNRAQELRAEEDRAKSLEEELSNIRFKSFEAEFNGRKEILNLATEESKKQLDIFKTAAREVASALAAVVNDQKEIAQLIASRGEIDISISDVQRDIEQALNVFDSGAAKQIASANASLQAVFRNRVLLQDSFDSQAGALGRGLQPVDTAEINEAADALSRALDGTAGKTDEQLAPAERERIALARAEVDILRQRIQAQNQLQAIEINRVRELEKTLRDEIKTRRDLIEANKQLLSLEAKRGETLLNDPLEFFNQLRQSNNARSFIGRAGINGPDDLVEKLSRLVRGNAGNPGALAVLREVEQGLKAAVAQGFQLVEGVGSDELLRAFQAAIVGGVGSNKGIQAEDDIKTNAELIQISNEELTNILFEQRKLVQEQIEANFTLAQFNQIEKRNAEEAKSIALQNISIASKQLSIAQEGFNKISEKVGQLGIFIDRLLKTDEFTTQVGLLNSSVQQIISLLQEESALPSQPAENAKLQRIIQETFRQFGANATGEQLAQLTDKLSGFSIDRIAPIISGLQSDSQTGDLAQGKIAAVLRQIEDRVSRFGANNQIERAVQALDDARISGEFGLDTFSSQSLNMALRDSPLQSFLTSLAQKQNVLGNPNIASNEQASRALTQEIEALRTQISKEIERISNQVAAPELIGRINELVNRLGIQDERDAAARDAALNLNPQNLAEALSKALSDRSIIPNESASDERQDFVAAIERAASNGVGTAFNRAIEELRIALADGVNINAQDINLKVNAEVVSQISSSPELIDAINQITGGNKEETQRILRVLQELIRLENQRGTSLSAETTGVGG